MTGFKINYPAIYREESSFGLLFLIADWDSFRPSRNRLGRPCFPVTLMSTEQLELTLVNLACVKIIALILPSFHVSDTQ